MNTLPHSLSHIACVSTVGVRFYVDSNSWNVNGTPNKSNCAHRRVLRNCVLYDVEQYWSPSLFACYAWLASTFTGEFLLVECLRCLERFLRTEIWDLGDKHA